MSEGEGGDTTDADETDPREDLRTRLRRRNQDSSEDRSGKRGEVCQWAVAVTAWAVTAASVAYVLLHADPHR